MTARIAMILICACSVVFAQPARRLEFEVATIKPSGPAPSREAVFALPFSLGPEHFTYPRASIFALLRIAYGLDNSQVVTPDWMKNELFDINAKAPDGTKQAQTNVMLQNLLADHFHLVLHHESRVMPVWELTVSKGGVKILDSSMGEPNNLLASPLPEQKAGGPLYIEPGKSLVRNFTRSEDGVTQAAGRAAPMSSIVFLLDRRLRGFDSARMLMDNTGLTGSYDFGIEFRDPVAENSPKLRDVKTDALGIFEAVEKYLGLKISEAKRPVEVIVVDGADRVPTDN